MGDFSDDTTGASDTDPYSSCTPWYSSVSDLTFAYTPETTGCYRFSAGDPDEDWYPTIIVGTSCDSFGSAGIDDECSDSGFISPVYGIWYFEAVVYKNVSAGNTQYMLVHGKDGGPPYYLAESGEFDAGIELVDSSFCD